MFFPDKRHKMPWEGRRLPTARAMGGDSLADALRKTFATNILII
jgi:hypothetical protein